MIKFEAVTEYQDKNINLPKRSTKYSAGYDIEAAKTIIVPSIFRLIKENDNIFPKPGHHKYYDIKTAKNVVKHLNLRTMIPTGLKVKMEDNMFLELHPRSGTGSNCLLQLANQTGIIDSDYYNNPDNEGHIFIALVNLSPCDIEIHKGDKIAQGIFRTYITTDDDSAEGERSGGFGSTDKNNK